jgi:SHS2 domain-containing protein
MECDPVAGYREIEHTADWELEVWAPDLPALLEQAARGMYALAGTKLQAQPHLKRMFKLSIQDEESLLVDFLNELLWLGEDEGVAFDGFNMSIDDNYLFADLKGLPIKSLTKEIKAVTFHNMNIERGASGLRVHIVFDV